MEHRNNIGKNRVSIFFLEDVFPVVEGVEGAAVLFTPLSNGKSAGGLLLKEGHPVVEFCLMNFLFSVHENLLMRFERNVRIVQIERKDLESLSHECGIMERYL